MANITIPKNEMNPLDSFLASNTASLSIFIVVVLVVNCFFVIDYYMLSISYACDDFAHRAVGGKPLLISNYRLHRSAS